MQCTDLSSMGRQESLASFRSLFPQESASGKFGTMTSSNKRIRISLTFTFEHESPATAALEHALRLESSPLEFGLDAPSFGSFLSCGSDYTMNDLVQRKSVIPSVHDVTQGMARITASS